MKNKRWGAVWEEKIKEQGETGVIHGVISSDRKIQNQLEEDMKFISPMISKRVSGKVKVLDCGIGPKARYAIEFSKKGYEVTGVDIAPTTIKLAKKWSMKAGQKINFVNANLIDLSSVPGKFDLVFCIETFGHIPEYLSLITMNQFNSKLKKGGLCFIHFWTEREKTFKILLWQFLYFSARRIKNRFRKVFDVNASDYTSEEIEDMCKRTGFKILEVKKLNDVSSYYILEKL